MLARRHQVISGASMAWSGFSMSVAACQSCVARARSQRACRGAEARGCDFRISSTFGTASAGLPFASAAFAGRTTDGPVLHVDRGEFAERVAASLHRLIRVTECDARPDQRGVEADGLLILRNRRFGRRSRGQQIVR
jgi:hypothetical protein